MFGVCQKAFNTHWEHEERFFGLVETKTFWPEPQTPYLVNTRYCSSPEPIIPSLKHGGICSMPGGASQWPGEGDWSRLMGG